MSLRDVEADYKAAYIAEHEAYKRAGRDDDADVVAEILSRDFGHDVEGKPKRQAAKRGAPERADQKAPEEAVPPKPERSGD